MTSGQSCPSRPPPLTRHLPRSSSLIDSFLENHTYLSNRASSYRLLRTKYYVSRDWNYPRDPSTVALTKGLLPLSQATTTLPTSRTKVQRDEIESEAMPYGSSFQNPSSSSEPMSLSSQHPQHLPSRSQHRPRPSLSQSHSPLPLQNTTSGTQQQALSQQQQHHEIMLQHHALMQQQQQQQIQQMQHMQGQTFYGSETSRSQMDDSISPKSEPKEFCLVAEAARRAEMAVLLRDMAEVAL